MLDVATCWLLGLSCPPPARTEPTVQIVQAAYEREAQRGSAKHDKDLAIVSLDCTAAATAGEHLCWVTFTSKTDKAQALFFDVASITRDGDAWTLKSGLCRR